MNSDNFIDCVAYLLYQLGMEKDLNEKNREMLLYTYIELKEYAGVA